MWQLLCVQKVGVPQPAVILSEDDEALRQPELHVPGGGEPCSQVSPGPGLLAAMRLIVITGTGRPARRASPQWRWRTHTTRMWRHWRQSSRRMDSNRFHLVIWCLFRLYRAGFAEHWAWHQLWTWGPGGGRGAVPGQHEDLPGILQGAGSGAPPHHGRQTAGGRHEGPGHGHIQEQYQVPSSVTVLQSHL